MKVLVVEDELLVARDIQRMLEKLGYQVPGLAISGEEAIELARQHHPDLVLMDVRLKGELDGIQTATIILSEMTCPIIYITAHSDNTTIERAKVTAPAGYLLKPIDMHQMRISVEMALHVYATEKRARHHEERFYTILRTTMDGFLIMDLTGKIQDANQAYCKLTGYTREELLEMRWQDVELSPVWSKMDYCLTDKATRFETVHRKKDGSLADVDVSINCLPEQNLFFAFLRDITDRKETQERILQLNTDLERQLVENQRLYQDEHEHRKLAEALVNASQVVSSTLDIDAVLDSILAEVGHIVPNDVCNIVLLNAEPPTVVRTHGYESFDASSFIETFVFPLEGVTIRKHIIATREPVVVPDVTLDECWQLSKERSWLRSYVATPIFVKDEVIGLLNVGISQPGFYNEEHGRWLSAFANQAAVAFHNAELFEKVQASAERLEFLSHRLLDVQETERRYLARELHDEIGQTLTATRISLMALKQSDMQEKRDARMKECLGMLDLALNQVRNMSLDLRPSMLDDLGLLPALRWYVDREASWGGFEAHINMDPNCPRMTGDLELTCFRIVQEALTNILRHANANHVKVSMSRKDDWCILSVEDDGNGFNLTEKLTSARHGASMGLIGMQERAALVGGNLEIESTPNKGTTIRAILPIHEENAPEERTI